MRWILIVLSALILVACTTPEQERRKKLKADRAARAKQKASSGEGGAERPAQPKPKPRPLSDTIQLQVRDADLATEVLPLFEQEVGVSIRWSGPPKSITLSMQSPIAWQEALDMLKQFCDARTLSEVEGTITLAPRQKKKLPSAR